MNLKVRGNERFRFGSMPGLERLLEHSFFTQNLKLTSVPSPLLIIQLPRYGKQKIFPRIVPPLKLSLREV